MMKYFLVALVLFFSACSIKEYSHTQSKIIIIKSPKIKFADVGYLRNLNDAIELELFMAGKSIKKITINHLVCVDEEGCMSKSGFNEEYLHPSYPTELLQNILLAKPIYNSKNFLKTESGFVQKIQNEDVNIKYEVNLKTIFFKDKKNNIILKFKETK